MMTSYFNLLKYAATGIASPDMTYYDKMRASTLMGATVKTLTGQPPLTFKADGTPLISWSMKGNVEQTGTPTPDNPVMPEFVGVRTGNLWNEDYAGISITITYKPLYVGNGDYTLSSSIPNGEGGIKNLFLLSGNVSSGASSASNGVALNLSKTVTAIDGYVTIAYRSSSGGAPYSPANYDTMLNLGSTALPYEPFGWAEKITCGGETTPVYLGQTQTVRRIKKLVLTGSETIGKYLASDTDYCYYVATNPADNVCLSSHVPYTASLPTGGKIGISARVNTRVCYINFGAAVMQAQLSGNTVNGLKEYLAEQYNNGTPVVIWYVRTTPETGITNEPLCKIGDYSDELHSEDAAVTIPTAKGQNTLTVDTPIQPSEMTIRYRE